MYFIILIYICLFIINSIKYLIFGTNNIFNDILFHYIEFSVFNNKLKDSLNNNIDILSNILLWSFFGLFPHNDTDRTINYIYKDITNKNQTEYIYNNITKTYLEDSSYFIEWTDSNKLLITISLFALVILFLFIFGIFSDIKNHLYRRMKNIKNNKIIKKKKSYYISNLLKIFLIGYCNISTITISKLFNLSKNDISLNIMTIIIFIFYIIGFPIFIFKLIYNNISKLYKHQFRNTYGVLYLHFKTETKYSSIIIILLIKQFIYSLLINLSYELTIIQNTSFLFINILHFILIIKYKPYSSSLDQLHATIVTISTLITTIINYVFITDIFSITIKNVFDIINTIIHIGTLFTFIILQCIGIYHKKRNITVISRRNINEIEMVEINVENRRMIDQTNNLLDSDPDYLKKKSTRFSDIIDNNL